MKNIAKVEEKIAEIAAKFAGVCSLNALGRDRADFHEIHVLNLKAALMAAFEAGKASK